MNNDVQIEALAEIEGGWTKCKQSSRGETWLAWSNDKFPFQSHLPNYLEDAAAMRRVIDALTPQQTMQFVTNLMDALDIDAEHIDAGDLMDAVLPPLPVVSECILRACDRWV